MRKSFYGKTRGDVAEAMLAYRAKARRRRAVAREGFGVSRFVAARTRYPPKHISTSQAFDNKAHHPTYRCAPAFRLTSDDVRFLLRRWRDDGVGATTQRAAFVTLSSALNVALREEKIYRNPCSTVPAPKAPRPDVAVLDGLQALSLIRLARGPDEAALLALAATTGMREGELFALFWEDLDLVGGTVSVRRTLTEDLHGDLVRSEPKTKKSRQTIYLSNLALAALLTLRDSREQPVEGFVFPSPDGTPLRKSNFIRLVFKPLLRLAGLPNVTFHSLRHTASSLLIEAGEDPLAIAGSLGHSDTRMLFERFGHLFNHTARRVAETTNRIFDELAANCRTTVVDAADRFGTPRKEKIRIANNDADFQLVEMRRLELLTPYMRSKCSTS